jgi:hypothetical protein
MNSLPPARANIGSAVNDTTRELGGALGVAIVGSIMSSLYATRLTDALADDVPEPVAAAARESLGAAVQASGTLRPDVADAAREAFVHAMSRASLTVAIVAALGAVIAWRSLPSSPGSNATHGSVARDVPAVQHQGVAVGVGEDGHVADAGVDGLPGERHAAILA